MDALYLKGGFRIVNTQAQMLAIPYLYRTLNDKEATVVYVRSTKILYQLTTNPSGDSTALTDWEPIELGGSSSFRPVGEWDPYMNLPELSDAGAAGRNGEFYFVINCPSPDVFTIPGLFQDTAVTLSNGAMIVSVGNYWTAISQTTSWDALVKPQVIIDYVNGIVIPHTHHVSDIVGFGDITGDFYTIADTADHTIPFDTVPNLAITEVEFLRTWYYTKINIDSQFLRKVGDTGVFAFTFANNQGIDSDGTAGIDVLNIGTQNADIINIGKIGGTVNINGTVNYNNQTNLAITDKLIRLNVNGAGGSGSGVGFEIEEGGTGVITGYVKTNGARDGYLFNTPASLYDADLNFSALSANRVFTFPDSSGTLALVASTLSTSLASGKVWLGNGGGTAAQVTLSGDVTVDNAGVTAIGANKVLTSMILNSNVTYAKIQNVTGTRLLGRYTGSSGVIEEVTLNSDLEFNGSAIRTAAFTGDVTKAAGGTALTIADDAVTYAKMQNVAFNNRVLGRVSGAAGDVEELTGTQVTALLDAFTSGLKGLAPASGGGTTNFLRADGTWAAPGGTGHAIYNGADVSPLTQRTPLRFRNGLTASDVASETVAELGGDILANTAITGAYILSLNTKAVSLFASAPTLNSGDKIMFMGVCTTPPAAAPTNGIYIWVEAVNGVYELRIMDSGGNIKGLS
jgi:hypothetical protein